MPRERTFLVGAEHVRPDSGCRFEHRHERGAVRRLAAGRRDENLDPVAAELSRPAQVRPRNGRRLVELVLADLAPGAHDLLTQPELSALLP